MNKKEENKTYLTVNEKKTIQVLNFIATFDGIITNEHDMIYILQHGIENFISPKKRHLVTIDDNVYPIKIKYKK